MTFQPKRVNRLIYTGFIVGLFAIVSMMFSAFVLVTTLSTENKTKTIIHERVLLATDKQLVETFISQLLTPESAKCFKALLQKESHMNSRAKNPTSSASGVGQLLSSTYKNIGMRHSDDPLSQVVASLSYISRHYGAAGPCGAWRYWQIYKSY